MSAPAACAPVHGAELDELRTILARLEVPDCDCPLDLSCPCGESCTGQAALDCPHCRGECDCPPALYQPPCRHVLQAAHGLSIERWHRLQLQLEPGPDDPPPPAGSDPNGRQRRRWWRWQNSSYRDPPPPWPPIVTLRPDARVARFGERYALGQALWGADDLQPGELSPRLLRTVERLRNGHPESREVTVLYRPPAELDDWDDFRMEAMADLAARRVCWPRARPDSPGKGAA